MVVLVFLLIYIVLTASFLIIAERSNCKVFCKMGFHKHSEIRYEGRFTLTKCSRCGAIIIDETGGL